MEVCMIGGLLELVTLLVAFWFLPQNFGRWWGQQMVLCRFMNACSVVRIP